MDLKFLLHQATPLVKAEEEERQARKRQRRQQGMRVSLLPPYAPISLKEKQVRVEPLYESAGDEGEQGALMTPEQLEEMLVNELGFGARRVHNALAILNTLDAQKVTSFLMENGENKQLGEDMPPQHLQALSTVIGMGFSFAQCLQALERSFWSVESAVSHLLNPNPLSSLTTRNVVNYNNYSYYGSNRSSLSCTYTSYYDRAHSGAPVVERRFPWKYVGTESIPKDTFFLSEDGKYAFDYVRKGAGWEFKEYIELPHVKLDVALDIDGNNIAHYACAHEDDAFVTFVADDEDLLPLFTKPNKAGEYPIEWALLGSTISSRMSCNTPSSNDLTDTFRSAMDATISAIESVRTNAPMSPKLTMWIKMKEFINEHK